MDRDHVMTPLNSRTVLTLIAVCSLLPLVASAQDAVTVGSATTNATSVDIPVYIRDMSGTALGIDQPTGSRIQSFSIEVDYSPAAAVSSVTFSRAGITAGLTPTFEASPSSTGSVSLLDNFQESTNLIPFTLNAAAPGDKVAHLVFNLSPSATPGSTITLTLNTSNTQLTNSGGTTKEFPNRASGNFLTLVNGAINLTPSATPGSTITLPQNTSNTQPTNSGATTKEFPNGAGGNFLTLVNGAITVPPLTRVRKFPQAPFGNPFVVPPLLVSCVFEVL